MGGLSDSVLFFKVFCVSEHFVVYLLFFIGFPEKAEDVKIRVIKIL
jgi:hypothetical protein